jgi:uncharacterized protein (DUF1015 family)
MREPRDAARNCYNRAYFDPVTSALITGLKVPSMAKIFPFLALRYDASKVSVAEVVTQPYDKISPAMQERYYNANPYNLVRIILGKAEPGDGPAQNVYTRAAGFLRDWKAEGVLVPDTKPSIYLYTQTFTVPGDTSGTKYERRGFIAAGQLEEYDQKIVFRHEQTLSKPKADRLSLLRATHAHFGQIFMLYSDPAGEVDSMLTTAYPPDMEATDEYSVTHRLWKISGPSMIARVQTAMADKKLIIADGHHRYETALNHRDEMRQKYENAPNSPFERVMMTFVNMDSPGLVVLPTHRVVFGLDGFDVSALLPKLHKYFEINEVPLAKDLETDLAVLRDASSERTALLAVTAKATYLLRAHPVQESPFLSRQSAQLRALDVVQLHKLVLEEVLGMSEVDIRDQKYLKYVREAREAVTEIRNGANVAFLMNPVKMSQVRDIAFSGEVMPQKSTDFFPKLLSGLTIYSLEEAAQSALQPMERNDGASWEPVAGGS